MAQSMLMFEGGHINGSGTEVETMVGCGWIILLCRSWLLDSTPSKVILIEITINSLVSLLFSLCIYIKVIYTPIQIELLHLFRTPYHCCCRYKCIFFFLRVYFEMLRCDPDCLGLSGSSFLRNRWQGFSGCLCGAGAPVPLPAPPL